MPHAVLEFGRPPEMVGRYEELYAPMPLRTTARAAAVVTFLVGYFLLCSATLFRIVFRTDSLKVMLRPLDFEAALPFLFFLLPLILSAFGAGVCDALFLPALFIVFEISFGERNYSLNLFHNTKLTKKGLSCLLLNLPTF